MALAQVYFPLDGEPQRIDRRLQRGVDFSVWAINCFGSPK